MLRGVIWTNFEVPDWGPGGGLFDEEGKLIGLHSRRSRFGGFVYSRMNELLPTLERLKQGEVWGDWTSGAGPILGVAIESVAQGCKITQVLEDFPATTTIEIDDIITKVEGRSVVSLEDIYEMLADNNPGDRVPH